MNDQERQALASIARRLLRDGHISTVEAAFIDGLLRQRPEGQGVAETEQYHNDQQGKPAVYQDFGDHDESIA